MEHIRAALAARGPHHLGLAVQADEEEVRLRGPIDSEAQRTDILAVVRDLAEGRRVVDDMEVSPGGVPDVRIERLP
ncbi:MAG TPA: BON domain-containing protein [Microthrixaceae bacterium]|nr:BON domain-containing protein [Microthrixaceae bacterium]